MSTSVANRSLLSSKRRAGNLKSPRSLKSPKPITHTRDIEYLNRFINCADPGKDAKEGGILNAQDGEALIEYVIRPVFNMGDLEKFDRDEIKGVGFNSEYLFKKINAAFMLASIPKQELLRPKFNANKYDLRFNNMKVAHDCGPGPDNLFAEYTLVLTPGSIMDPAKRDKNHTPQISALDRDHTLSAIILEQLDLKLVKSIGFSKKGGYKIQIKTGIKGYEDTTFSFNDTFETESDFFAGNPTKNKAMKEILLKGKITEEDKGKMQMYMLIKELGDTLQVMWLKDVIDTTPLSRSNTAICTCDSVVWLRSIVNNVSCIYTENRGTLTTLYPAYEDDKSKLLTLIFMKEQAIEKLNNANESVIDTLSTFLRVIDQNGVEINDYDIDDRGHPEGFREVVKDIIGNLQKVLITRNKDILNQMRKLAALDQEALNRIYEFSEKNTMLTPFIINEKKLAIRTRNGYTHVFKNKQIPFYPGLIYTLLKKKGYDSKQDSDKIFPKTGGMNGEEAEAAEILFGFRGSQEEEGANILDMLKNAPKNSKMIRGEYTDEELDAMSRKEFKKEYEQVDTIQTDFLLDTSYELILIGYAYAIQVDVPLSEQIKKFFHVKYFMNNPLEELKPLLAFLTSIYKGVSTEATLFDLYNFENVLTEAVEPRALDKKIHGNALVIYQILFESEYFLTLRTIRGEKNPVDDGDDEIKEQLKDSSDSDSVGAIFSPEGSVFSPQASVGPMFSPAASVGAMLSPAQSIHGEGSGSVPGSAPGTQSTFGERGHSYGTQPTDLSQHPMYELTAESQEEEAPPPAPAPPAEAPEVAEFGSNTQTHEHSESSNVNMKGGKKTRKRNKKQKAKIDL